MKTILISALSVLLLSSGYARAGSTDPRRSIEDIIEKSYLGSLEESPKMSKVLYEYALVDLNRDLIKDAVVMVYCRGGSGGYPMLILRGSNSGFTLVSKSTVTRDPIFLSRNSVHGWHTLIVSIGGGGGPSGEALMVFNGKRYPSNPSLEPLATEADFKGALGLRLKK